MLVNVFDSLLRPPLRSVNVPLILSISSAWLPVVLDATYLFPNNRTLAIGLPALLGTGMQCIGGGVTLPIYWLISLLVRLATREKSGTMRRPDKFAVIGAVLGIILGTIPITIAMVVKPTQLIITLWQPMPLYCSAIQIAVVCLLSKGTSDAATGMVSIATDRKLYTMTQLAYAICALVVVPGHIFYVRAIVHSETPLEELADTLLPYPYVYSYRSMEDLFIFGPANEVKRFLQWDSTFIVVSTWLGGAWPWAFSGILNFLQAITTSVAGAILLGPGALMVMPHMIHAWKDEKARIKRQGVVADKKAQ